MGLSSNSQRCITQDKEGFIWIGTADGLNRFDGYSFKVFRKNPNDSTRSLKSNIINCLFTDSYGNLWIGAYSGGLSRYNKEKDNFYNYPGLINENINTIVEDKYHRLWVGSTLGLYMIDLRNNKLTRFLANVNNPFDPATIANNEVDRIIIDNNNLWISYSTGLFSALNITDMKFKHYTLFHVSGHETADFSVNSMVLDNENIWISTWSKGIWIFNKTTGGCRPYESEKSQYINFIFKDNKNRFWYSPEYKGLMLVDGKQQINFKEDDFNRNSISSNLLSNIFQDKQGNLWLTSKLGDLNYVVLDNPFYNWYKNPNSKYELSSNLINTVMEDSKRRIWIGYEEGGIDLLDADNIKPKIHINGDNLTKLGPGPVLDIFESKNGDIWITKYLDGLKKFNESTRSFTSYQHSNGNEASIAGNDVRHISEDSHGNLWLSIHGGGVDKFNPKTEKVIHYKHDSNNLAGSILSDWTYTALCDKQDNIWVATIAGVSVISENKGVIKQYTRNDKNGYSLSADLAYIIFADSKNFVWIGTSDGLNKLDPKTGIIKKYFTKDGLPGNLIIDILEDNACNIWVSTTNGLSRFFPRDETFKNFSVRDGLATDEFNKLASFKNRKNEIYFGGRDGLTRFNPDSIKINNFKPPVYITDFKLFNQSVNVKKDNISKGFTIPKQIAYCNEITLDHDQNEITLEFAALNYLNLEKNLYKYKLEGFDNHWSIPGNKREVTYTNLDQGEYTFRVIASNNDGVWNTQGASLKIIIKPPFWKTNLAYALYFSFVIFLLYVFRKLILHEADIKRKLELEELEIQKLHEMDLLKMQFFANVSHEFRTPLTLIIGPIENLLREMKDEFRQVQLKIIHRNANRLLRLINQLMDFRKIEEARLELNPTKNDIVLFIREIVDTFKQDAAQHSINFEFKHTHPSFEIWFDTDKLDKIIFNLLSNAFKFTRDGGSIEISIDLNCEPNMAGIPGQSNKFLSVDKIFKIIIKDTGIGIPKDFQSKIFDRFYQVKNTLNKQGTGIGLSLTNELIKLHFGEIIVESTPDVGSEFTVVLPLWLEENELPDLTAIQEKKKLIHSENEQKAIIDENIEPGEIKEEYAVAKDKLPKILIVEDNADMRLFIKNEFKESYNVLEAHDGIIGLQKAFEEIPDAIICDVMMPGKDGFEVCRTLKNDERTSHIPIVMLTAKSSEQHTIEGFESGADDYVAKPFSSTVLKVRIKNLIESRILLRKKFTGEPFATLTEISPSKTDELLFKKAYAIVEKNLNNANFEVNDFAYEIGMSRTQLYRKINAISGQSVKEFIRIIRLKKAAELLVTRENNVSEVAFSVGFNSLSYFTTSFTEYYGMNPSKYVEKFVK
jgi:signal transduction histidine kinase/ligand-binding sensor domain-containing protein/DNA-binding response OmpR family regulator